MAIALADKRRKRFSDFATESPPLDGDKIRLDSVLNREVEIIGCRLGTTKYSKNKTGKYLTLQVLIDKTKHVIFTGSDVLIQQMEKYEPEMPFTAIILKINRYYTLS